MPGRCNANEGRVVSKRMMIGAGALAVVVLTGMVATRSSVIGPAVAMAASPQFELCGMVHKTCVVDGDTFWLEGRKVRIADIDTPEVNEPKCDSEYALGMKATHRLRDLLNAGAFELKPIPGRDQDRYGRDLRVVVRNGRSIGDQLVSEGLARTWSGRREPWC